MMFKYQIIILNNGKQVEFINSYRTKSNALKAFKKLIDTNKKEIIFPVRYVNLENITEANYEAILIKRKEENDNNIVKLRNEYGEYVDHVISNNSDWIVFDKEKYEKEETFWVYGFHPKYQRKTFLFIYNEMLKPKASDKYNFVNMIIFKNKLLLDTTDNLDIIICKNESDCIRLYNQLEEWSKNDKLKYIMFSGFAFTNRKCGKNEEKKQYWLDRIKEVTSWSNKKILRRNTRP